MNRHDTCVTHPEISGNFDVINVMKFALFSDNLQKKDRA